MSSLEGGQGHTSALAQLAWPLWSLLRPGRPQRPALPRARARELGLRPTSPGLRMPRDAGAQRVSGTRGTRTRGDSRERPLAAGWQGRARGRSFGKNRGTGSRRGGHPDVDMRRGTRSPHALPLSAHTHTHTYLRDDLEGFRLLFIALDTTSSSPSSIPDPWPHPEAAARLAGPTCFQPPGQRCPRHRARPEAALTSPR